MQQLLLDLPHKKAYGREDYFISKCNTKAIAFIDKYPLWNLNALIIYGEISSGKTHLAHVFQEKVQAYIYDASIINEKTPSEIFQEKDNVIVEDLDINKIMEEKLLHFLNYAKNNNLYVLITSAYNPTGWKIELADLKSRINSISSTAIEPPDDTLISVLLIKMFHDKQIKIAAKEIKYIVSRIDRSYESIKKTVDLIDSLSLQEKKKISAGLLKRILESDF